MPFYPNLPSDNPNLLSGKLPIDAPDAGVPPQNIGSLPPKSPTITPSTSLPPGLSSTKPVSNLPSGLSSQLPPGLSFQAPSTLDEEPEVDYEQMAWKDVLTTAVKNVPESGKQALKDMAKTITDPIGTVKALGNLVIGAFEKVIPGEQEKEENVDLLIDYYKEQYGSIEGFKKAIAKKPVEVLTDGASILIPGGAAIKGLGTASKATTLTKLGNLLTKTGTTLDIPSGITKGLGRVAGAVIPKKKVLSTYQKASSFGTSMPKAIRDKITQFALDKRIMPTTKGIEKIQRKVNLINVEISDLIDRAVITGKEIPVKELKKGFKELEKTAHITSFGKATEAKAVLNKISKDIYENNLKFKKGSLNPKEVQRIKQNIYSDFKKFYNLYAKVPMEGKAFKLIAKNAKNSLEDIFPELENLKHVKEIKGKTSLKDLNALESNYLSVLDALESPKPFSLGDPLSKIQEITRANLGYTIGGPQVAGLALLNGLFNSKKIKAKMAIMANSLKKQGITLSPAWYELGIVSRLPARLERQE